MNNVKLLSKILLVISRLLSLLYFLIFTYALITLVGRSGALNISKDGKFFEILIPLTRIPFLLGFYNQQYIWLEFLPIFLLYALFFLLLSYIFYVFAQDKLFTYKGYNYLRIFYVANFTVPLFMLLLTEFLAEASFDSWALVGMHILLGIFIYFMAAIFNQGLKLQNEQDLII